MAIAAISLLAPWALAFDPWAWVSWGRDLTRLQLDTAGGPSWKPLPVLFTTPFALTGDAAPLLWLLVSRAAGLLALVGAGVLVRRLGGGVSAALTAAALLVLSEWWFFNTALGNSEGFLVAAVVWAAIAHLDGRERVAVAFGIAAALQRPEAWPFVGLYLLWLWRARGWSSASVALALAPVPALWFGPDPFGAGGALGASDAARASASPQSAVHAAIPARAVLADAVALMRWPVLVAALVGIAVLSAPRAAPAGKPGAGRNVACVLALGALAWVALVAVMTQVGYAGNPRYNVVPAAIACVLAGLSIAAFGRWRALAALALVVLVAALGLGGLRAQLDELGTRAERRSTLFTLLDRTDPTCEPVYTNQPMKAMVGWRLELRLENLADPPRAPGSALSAPEGYDGGPSLPRPLGRESDREGEWTLSAECG